MSLLIALATAAAAATAPTPAPTPADASADRAARLAALPASDRDIHIGLWRALEIDPSRVVCSIRLHAGSRQPRKSCSTIQAWFDNRLPGEIQKREAPWQLVEEIKDQRKKALMKR